MHLLNKDLWNLLECRRVRVCCICKHQIGVLDKKGHDAYLRIYTIRNLLDSGEITVELVSGAEGGHT